MKRYEPVISTALKITVYAMGAGAIFTLAACVVLSSLR